MWCVQLAPGALCAMREKYSHIKFMSIQTDYIEMATRGKGGRSVTLTTYLRIEPRLRLSRSLPSRHVGNKFTFYVETD